MGTSSHQVLWETTLLYLMDHGLMSDDDNPDGGEASDSKALLSAILGDQVLDGRLQWHRGWNRHVVSTGCEIVRLGELRRGSLYQQYLSFVKAHTGRHGFAS